MSRLENIVLYLMLVFGISALMALGTALVYSVKSAELRCAKRWEGAYQTTFTYRNGCKVVIDGKPIPELAVRALVEAAE